MSLDEKFNQAAEDVKKLRSRPTDDDLLEIYAWFKQATVGDVNTERPTLLELKAKAKWDSWASKKGTSKEEAQQKYIDKVKSLIDRLGYSYYNY